MNDRRLSPRAVMGFLATWLLAAGETQRLEAQLQALQTLLAIQGAQVPLGEALS
jgi:hypothetical protein